MLPQKNFHMHLTFSHTKKIRMEHGEESVDAVSETGKSPKTTSAPRGATPAHMIILASQSKFFRKLLCSALEARAVLQQKKE
jgi:hypothetical protein